MNPQPANRNLHRAQALTHPNRHLRPQLEGDHVISFTVNGKPVTVEDPPSTPLLWVIRDSLHLTGTKYGCGMALCGACTVHIDGEAVRSCVAPVSRAQGKKVTTIEGIFARSHAPAPTSLDRN